MKQHILLLFLSGILQTSFSQEIYKATSGEISFFSETPVEDIDATNKLVKALINTKNNEVVFITTIIGFHFKKPLMEEHFNENYMESDKYKAALFKGVMNGDVDYKKDGEYSVKAKGVLNIHGVDKEREIDGKIIVKGETIELNAEFDVKLADHDIEVPKLVMTKIAEIVSVKMEVNFEKK